jgi:hypothetical protein
MPWKVGVLVLFGCALASGCVQNPISVHSTNNVDVPVEKLFTHEGCTVYRFRDGNYHYYVRCDGVGTATTQSMGRCGKGCGETIPTFVAGR